MDATDLMWGQRSLRINAQSYKNETVSRFLQLTLLITLQLTHAILEECFMQFNLTVILLNDFFKKQLKYLS